MPYRIRRVSWQEEGRRLKQIREKVFVCEWRIPRRLEFDEQDKEAKHVLITDDNDQPLAAGRISANGQISRVAVIINCRHSDLAVQVINALLDIAREDGLHEVFINVPLEEVSLYCQQGFSPCGAVYMEAGLPMQRLTCPVGNVRISDFHLCH